MIIQRQFRCKDHPSLYNTRSNVNEPDFKVKTLHAIVKKEQIAAPSRAPEHTGWFFEFSFFAMTKAELSPDFLPSPTG
jgi:hypothetical protein